MIRVVRGGMEQSELQHLKQQVQGVRLECETLIAQLYACLLKKREHSLWVNQVENQQELSIRILKTRISRSRTGPYVWVSEYCQQELMIKQEQFSAMNRRHAQDAQCLQAEQEQCIARGKALVGLLEVLNDQIVRLESQKKSELRLLR